MEKLKEMRGKCRRNAIGTALHCTRSDSVHYYSWQWQAQWTLTENYWEILIHGAQTNVCARQASSNDVHRARTQTSGRHTEPRRRQRVAAASSMYLAEQPMEDRHRDHRRLQGRRRAGICRHLAKLIGLQDVNDVRST